MLEPLEREALQEKAATLAWRIAGEEKRIKAADAQIARYKGALAARGVPSTFAQLLAWSPGDAWMWSTLAR